jgi:imidazolonepropionase-like amidohydrolase
MVQRGSPTFFVLALLLLCLAAPAVAQSDPPAPKTSLLIRAGHLLDVRSGRVLTDQAILVEGDRIKEAGPAANVAGHAPAGTKTIELQAVTVLPGLIDSHAHVLGNPKDLSPAAHLRMSGPQETLWGVHNLGIWLDHGFTSLRDACESALGYGQVALRDSINRGLIRGPRMVTAGTCISITGGHGDDDLLAPDQALPRRSNLATTWMRPPTRCVTT